MDNTPVPIELTEHPFFWGYLGVFVIAALVCCVRLLICFGDRMRHRPLVNAWMIGWSDFGIFAWIVFCWTILANVLVAHLSDLPESSDEIAGMPVRAILWSGMLIQGGMIVLFLFYRAFFWQLFSAPINSTTQSIFRSAKAGLFYFLAFAPILWIVAICWSYVIQWMRFSGIEWEMAPQDMVQIIMAIEDRFLLVTILFLAIVLAPIAEELIFRAAIYRFLKSRFRFSVAAIISSTLFAFAHANFLGFPSFLAIGVFLCLVYEWSGNIKTPIFFHAYFNLNSIVLILLQP